MSELKDFSKYVDLNTSHHSSKEEGDEDVMADISGYFMNHC